MIADTISFLLLVAAFWTLIILTQIISEQNTETGRDEDIVDGWQAVRDYSAHNWQTVKGWVSRVRHR